MLTFLCESFERTRLRARRRDKQSQSGQAREPTNEQNPGTGRHLRPLAPRSRLNGVSPPQTAALINWRETSATVCRSFTFIRLAVGVLINDVVPLLQRLLQGRLELPRQQRGLVVHLQRKKNRRRGCGQPRTSGVSRKQKRDCVESEPAQSSEAPRLARHRRASDPNLARTVFADFSQDRSQDTSLRQLADIRSLTLQVTRKH